jgi:histidinol-phosphate phosphatase family protein
VLTGHPVRALLVDRDGTIVVDVPYNGDPARVVAMPGAAAALDRVRAAGLPVALVTNQSGLARGHFTERDLAAVTARVDELLGPFAAVEYCPHGEDDGCACRKPQPGMVLAAAARLGVDPAACVMVGDTAADVAAAEAAGAVGVLVPNAVTLPEEVAAARHVARDLAEAVDRYVLGTGAAPSDAAPGDAAATDPVRTWPPPVGAPSPPPPGPPAGARPPEAARARDVSPRAPGRRRGDRPVLVTRFDNAGDVLLAGPAIRAVARDNPVVLAVGPAGRAVAEVLPGVDHVVELAAPWVLGEPPPVDSHALARFTAAVAAHRPVAAAVLTSSHQSALPTALLLRMAGVPEIAAVSLDYPGSLLDHRIPGDPDVHEVERALAVVGRLGHQLPPGEDALAVRLPDGPPAAQLAGRLPQGPYVVVHPGASVAARTLAPGRWRAVARALAAAGHRVVVTGSAAEVALTAHVASGVPGAVDLGGACSFGELARVLAGADAVTCGNTGPMHLAAAVGTPVAAVFAPTVPAVRWRPWRVPHVLLGDQDVSCRGCRARECPVPGQPCLAPVGPDDVVAAVERLLSGPGTGDVPVLRGTVADRPHAVTGPVPLEPTEEVR